MIFDSHCHLDPRTYGGDAGVDAVIATAHAAGVSRMLTVGSGYGDGSADHAVKVADRHASVWASVGFHPHDAKELNEATLAHLIELSAHPKVVAWGEIGLDFFYDNSPRDTQRAALRRQLAVALELKLPVILHDRDSEGELLSILIEEGAFEGAGVLYHCYAGDVAEMEQIVARGGYISIPGTVTYRRSDVAREVVAAAPAERILVETDAPFLTPEPLRGRKNEPCHVALTLDYVAGLRGVGREEMARLTTDNARRLFGV